MCQGRGHLNNFISSKNCIAEEIRDIYYFFKLTWAKCKIKLDKKKIKKFVVLFVVVSNFLQIYAIS